MPVYTVVLGTDAGTITVPGTGRRHDRPATVPPDPGSLAEIAQASGGKAYTAQTATRLDEIYKSLGSQLGREDQKASTHVRLRRRRAPLLLVGGIACRCAGSAG